MQRLPLALGRPKPALKPALSAAAGREASYRGGLTRGGVARGSNSYSRNDARFVTHSFECNRHFPCNCSGKGRGRPGNHCCREATITTVKSVTTKVLYEPKRSAGSGRAGSKNTEHVGAGCWWNGEVLQDRNPSTRTLPRAIEFGILQEDPVVPLTRER